jgi:hypothetical protein
MRTPLGLLARRQPRILNKEPVCVNVIQFEVEVETALFFHFLTACRAGLVFLFVEGQGFEDAEIADCVLKFCFYFFIYLGGRTFGDAQADAGGVACEFRGTDFKVVGLPMQDLIDQEEALDGIKLDIHRLLVELTAVSDNLEGRT